jgi:hypothetical protein
MNRPLVSSLLLGTVGATLALTAACGDGGGGTNNNGGTSGAGPSAGGTAPIAGTSTAGGSSGTGGSNTPQGGSGGMATGGSAGTTPMSGGAGGGAGAGAGMAGTGSPAGGGAGMGAGGGAAGSGTAGTGATGNCMATGAATASTKILNVFNVAVTTDLAGFDGGQIDFGLDTTYGFTAPIDMAAGKTTLLGMKPNKTYHYRVTAKAGTTGMCVGTDQTLETGGSLNGFPMATISPTTTPANAVGGFMISEFYGGSANRQIPFILDKDLEVVWAYDTKVGQTTRARMSLDGKYMWAARANVPSQKAGMMKVAMDGSSEMDMSDKFARMNHDFTIIDDEHQTMYFIAYSNDQGSGCDDVMEFDPVTNMSRKVMNAQTAFPSGACHCNAIQWSQMDDSLVVSDLDHAGLFKIDRKTGAVKWVLNGGSDNDFTGDGATWTGPEHNFHLIGPDHLVLFNNVVGMGSMSMAGASSLAIEIKLDETAKTATKMWTYTPSKAIQNVVMGDAQRMPNGNTIVAYSTQGVVHEVDAAGMLIRSISWGTGGAIGYIIARPTLYGKPPR